MALSRVVLVGLFLGAAGLGACTSVRHVQPVAYLEDNSPSVVWVTYVNNTIITVAEPVIKRDTLRGMLQGERVKIPLGEIRSVQAKVRDRTKTALLLVTLGVAAISGLYFGFISKSEGAGSEGCGTDGYGDLIPEC